MEQNRYGGALAALSVLILIIVFSIWPPPKAESKAFKLVKSIDSMNNMNKVEVDLFKYKKQRYEERIYSTADSASADSDN